MTLQLERSRFAMRIRKTTETLEGQTNGDAGIAQCKLHCDGFTGVDCIIGWKATFGHKRG